MGIQQLEGAVRAGHGDPLARPGFAACGDR